MNIDSSIDLKTDADTSQRTLCSEVENNCILSFKQLKKQKNLLVEKPSQLRCKV